MTFKGLKCVKISKSEYEDVLFILSIASCYADAFDKATEYLIKDKRVDVSLPRYVIHEMATNLVMAVDNNYKYMKIEEVR